MSEFDGDLESAGRLIKAVIAGNRRAKKKRQPTSKKAIEPSAAALKTKAICKELDGLGVSATSVHIAFKDATTDRWKTVAPIDVFPVVREYRWTEKQPGFQAARRSAINATIRLLAETQALRCSSNADSPHIEQMLFEIRSGLLKADNPRIQQLVGYAQQIGRSREIFRQIADALHDADRRKNDGTLLPDLNKFHLAIAYLWTGFLFWLMSDDNIARFMVSNHLVSPLMICNPTTITKARKKLGLIKSRRLPVKSVGPHFLLGVS